MGQMFYFALMRRCVRHDALRMRLRSHVRSAIKTASWCRGNHQIAPLFRTRAALGSASANLRARAATRKAEDDALGRPGRGNLCRCKSLVQVIPKSGWPSLIRMIGNRPRQEFAVQGVKEKISMKSAAIVAAALALSATVMPAEPLPVARPSGPPQGAQEAMSNDTCAWSSTAQVRRLLRHRSARHNAHRSHPQPR